MLLVIGISGKNSYGASLVAVKLASSSLECDRFGDEDRNFRALRRFSGGRQRRLSRPLSQADREVTLFYLFIFFLEKVYRCCSFGSWRSNKLLLGILLGGERGTKR